jgi:hypothetical protein
LWSDSAKNTHLNNKSEALEAKMGKVCINVHYNENFGQFVYNLRDF